ncbi:RNA polymerase recycling motor ATPase HelR [Geodermatophilus sp. SYSU D01106]
MAAQTPLPTSAFDLPARLAAKADPALVAADEAHFAAMADSLRRTVAELSGRLDAERRAPGGTGQEALDRDLEVHRLTARLRTLRRFGLDLCLGRMVPADGGAPVYVGRLGLTDGAGGRLLVDWRSPAAEPFFGATHADPMGLASRRRYRWTRGRITDYWDEVFTPDGLEGHAALDDQSAFVASLGTSRSPRMRDVLGTIQADQDAIIRAGSRGALVVDGGPGTGKTVVALHRTAYLLYADPRLGHRRGGVLFVGPSRPYLTYVADVLPGLGEEGVRTCTLRDLVPEGAAAVPEPDPEVARLKADARMVAAVEPAVRLYEVPPATGTDVVTPWGDVRLDPADWSEAFAAAEPGSRHNDARDRVWEALLDVLVDKLTEETDEDDDGDDEDDDQFDAYGLGHSDPHARYRRALAGDRELVGAFGRAWPLLEPADLVGDLWSVPAYLRRCAPWLTPEEVALLQRPDPAAWTVADLPLLDAARQRLGDPAAARLRRRREAEVAADRARMSDVVEHLITTDDSDMGVMSMLRGQDLRGALVDDAALPAPTPDALAGPFAHVVVDEAQELTDAEWQMLLLRCPSRSLTVVGDRAQARHGFAESWEERLARVGVPEVSVASLTVNYRTPAEVMAEAEPVIRAALPDANVPTSVRSSGVPVSHGAAAELAAVLDDWLAAHAEGTACVIGAPGFRGSERVRSLTPVLAKGLEFDLVVLVDPDRLGTGVEGAVDRYVAMTRATSRLVVLTSSINQG